MTGGSSWTRTQHQVKRGWQNAPSPPPVPSGILGGTAHLLRTWGEQRGRSRLYSTISHSSFSLLLTLGRKRVEGHPSTPGRAQENCRATGGSRGDKLLACVPWGEGAGVKGTPKPDL